MQFSFHLRLSGTDIRHLYVNQRSPLPTLPMLATLTTLGENSSLLYFSILASPESTAHIRQIQQIRQTYTELIHNETELTMSAITVCSACNPIASNSLLSEHRFRADFNAISKQF